MKQLRSRFDKNMNKAVEQFTASISYDQRLFRQDIMGSISHCKMLSRQAIISEQESELIISGLASIQEEIQKGKFNFDDSNEDIHMSIEARLFEKIGDTAGKLHIARSRNDQVATDLRLYTMESIQSIIQHLKDVQTALINVAKSNIDVVLPGYTHLQRAQPILLAHHFMAYFEMFQRDVERFNECFKQTDVLPLGSGALAGVPYNIDRQFVADQLGFSRISNNSLDAVSDRDFVIDFQAAAATAMMHLSRLSEEMILWSSAEFGFIEIDDAFTTGSSVMPQKKNPDVAELTRGKVGRVYGNLMAILTTMKSLPLAYNRDLQEDKEGLFDTIDTLSSALNVYSSMLGAIKINSERMVRAASENYSLATDVADYLAKKGLPFREAHTIVSQLTRHAISQNKSLDQLPLADYQSFSTLFEEDVYNITVETSINMRNVPGGTASEQVLQAIEIA